MPHLLKQRYLITETLGQGGMGVVYKARDTQLGDRFVAIKEMRQSSDDQLAVDAFKREADILAHLMHPHLPSIHEHFTESGYWYLVMDFIEGQTLEKYLKTRGGWLPCDEVIEIGLQLCTILDYLHNRQPPIVFRDLKPLNIMRTFDGHIYLIDFGIARHFKRGQTSDTAIAFSVGYAAPEQYPTTSTQTTPLADIYSLGATFYQLLTGRNPSSNQPTPFHFSPLPLHERNTSQELVDLIMQMVELEPDKRPASITYIKQRLQHITAQRLLSPATRPEVLTLATTSSSGPDAPTFATSSPAAWPEAPTYARSSTGPSFMDQATIHPTPLTTTRRGPSRRVILASLAALTVAASGVIGWNTFQHHATSTPKPTPVIKTKAATPAPTQQPVLPPTLEIAINTAAASNMLTTFSSTDGTSWPSSPQTQNQIQLQGSPALITFNQKRYLVFISNDTSNTLYITASDSQNWPVARPLAMQTPERPAIVVFNNMLYIAYQANDSSNLLYIASSADGQNWSASTAPNAMHLQGSPTLAVLNQTLYVAFKAADMSGALCLASSTDGQNWSTVTEYGTNLLMQGSPSMVQMNNTLYIAFRSYDSSNTLYVTSSADGQNWPAGTAFNQTLQGDPSMTAFDNKLYIAYQANDSSNSLYVTSSTDGQNWSTARQFITTLQDSPTIAAFS